MIEAGWAVIAVANSPQIESPSVLKDELLPIYLRLKVVSQKDELLPIHLGLKVVSQKNELLPIHFRLKVVSQKD